MCVFCEKNVGAGYVCVSTPRYLTWCFASSSKIEEKALVLSENFKTLMHYGFLMKLSA